MSSEKFDGLQHAVEVHQVAQRLLDVANGIMLSTDAAHQPVTLSGTYMSDSGTHHVVQAVTAVSRSRARVGAVIVGDGEPAPAPLRKEQRYAALAAGDPEVDEALRTMSAGDLDWSRLYKVYEIVRESYGGEAALISAEPGVTKAQVGAFTGSANRPDVSGPTARHARMAGAPPRRSMSLQEGRDFIRKLMRLWMDSKLS